MSNLMSNSKMKKTLGDWASGLHLMKKTHMSHGRKTGYMLWERGALALLYGEQSYNERNMLDIVLVIFLILLNTHITVYYIYYYTYLYLYILSNFIIYITNYHYINFIIIERNILYSSVFKQNICKFLVWFIKKASNTNMCIYNSNIYSKIRLLLIGLLNYDGEISC